MGGLSGIQGKLGAWSEAHALASLLLVELGLLVFFGRRGRGREV